GFVGFAVAASFGLAWLTARLPRRRHLIVGLAALLVLIEYWPRPFPQETIPPTPAFYEQIASDPEEYGVFDLPFKPGQGYTYGLSYIQNSSLYQVFQIDHHKGIAGGYLSRTYVKHPLFPDVMSNFSPNVLRDGYPAVYANF